MYPVLHIAPSFMRLRSFLAKDICDFGAIIDVNMEVVSSDDVALVEVFDPFGRGLDVQFSFLYVTRRCLRKALSHLAKRDFIVKVGVRVTLVEDLVISGCIPERQPFMKVHH